MYFLQMTCTKACFLVWFSHHSFSFCSLFSMSLPGDEVYLKDPPTPHSQRLLSSLIPNPGTIQTASDFPNMHENQQPLSNQVSNKKKFSAALLRIQGKLVIWRCILPQFEPTTGTIGGIPKNSLLGWILNSWTKFKLHIVTKEKLLKYGYNINRETRKPQSSMTH